VKRFNAVAVLSAMALLANPFNLMSYPTEKRAELLGGAAALVRLYGHRVGASKHPAELERRARQRRRACQTHPGKRGRS
jgi:hypothetical protein